MYSTPGSHALLLGAGVSVAAGVPSAWAVEEELVRRVGLRHGVAGELPEPHEWLRERFGVEANYDSIIEMLAPSRHERQGLLRGFFEPQGDELEREVKRPTAAHRAIARLVVAGVLRVIITLNFDRLVEQALRDEGVEPTVVASAADIEGLAPVHTIRVLIVHLHGDYLTATSMRNTMQELAAYEPAVIDFLHRLLVDHALVIVGWSGKHDHALRDAMIRGMRRQYTSYWVEPADLSEVAEHLRSLQGIVAVRSDADTAMGVLADAVTALHDRDARHPLALPVLVASAKRDLSGRTTAVGVHDLLRTEMAVLHEHPDLALPSERQPDRPMKVITRGLREASMTSAALLAATAYWGDERTDQWWLDEVVRLAHQRRGDGYTSILALPRVCGAQLFGAAAVASIAAKRYTLTRRLLDLVTTDAHGRDLPLFEALQPSPEVQTDLQTVFVEHLALGTAAYEDSWEVFELLLLVQAVAGRPHVGAVADRLAAAEESLRRAQRVFKEAEAQNSADLHDHAEAALHGARKRYRRAQEEAAGAVAVHRPHLRVTDGFGTDLPDYPPVIGRQLLAALDREGAEHPLVVARVAGGDGARLRSLLAVVCLAVGRAGREAAHRAMDRPSGAVPGYLWLDTGERPAQ